MSTLLCSVCQTPVPNPSPYQTECDEHDGTIPCPSPRCQCESCQAPCIDCGIICGWRDDALWDRTEWRCYDCHQEFLWTISDDENDICPPIPRG